ncbi:MAG: sigma-54 dependent transcriptional regulator [Acidobacteriota bacterium]
MHDSQENDEGLVLTGPPPRALIADDQRDVLESLRFLLRAEGWQVDTVTSPRLLVERLKHMEVDVVLIDLNYTRDTTSGQEGLDLIRDIQAVDAALPIVVMTAWASVELAVEAMRRGASDFVEKPWDNQRLLSILRAQTALSRAVRRGHRLEAENRLLRNDAATEMIAESKAMAPVMTLIERVGPSDANVLITGENGTGKGLVAQVLHRVSKRAERPLITVNIGGLSETIFESELFGHVKGAFTDAKSDRVGRFELASSGTLFMDEIANMTLSQQARLLRVLETGELERVGSSRTRQVDVRLVSATNADLDDAVREGTFRQDLLFRLNTVEIPLPPLRERREDIPLLAHHFLAEQARHYGKDLERFDDQAMQAMLGHAWPGNVRELSHVIERAVLMADGQVVRAADLGLTRGKGEGVSLEEMSLEEVEKLLINKALERHSGNVSDAARALGLSRSALYRRLEKYGI